MAELWKELHTRALTVLSDDSEYLKTFQNKIPRYTSGCKCQEFWIVWIKTNPPTYGEKYFEWTTMIHNQVNKKLGKPQISVEDARKLYV